MSSGPTPPSAPVHAIVSPCAMRPASDKRQCFYCQQPISSEHKPECVLIKRKVKVRMAVEYEIEVPAHWDKQAIEFHRNESSWCAGNAIDELKAIDDQGCLCPVTKYEYLEDAGEPYLSEG